MSGYEHRIQRVALSPTAAMSIRREALRSDDGNETGGLLLGHIDAERTARVSRAGDPGPAAVHGPSFFLRDLHHAQSLADEAFVQDRSLWIGEWHTHPGAAPIPSNRDLSTYVGLLADPELCFTAFVSLILVAPTEDWRQPIAHAWICYHGSAERVPLTVMSDSMTS